MIEIIDELKQETGIECANCHSCSYLGSESDGNWPEYAVDWPVCMKEGHERYEFLKPFPFNTEQKCWWPSFWHSKFSDLIDGSDESYDKATSEFRNAVGIED